MMERHREIDTIQKFYDRICDDNKTMNLDMRGDSVCVSCPVRWQPWQRVEVRFVVLECEQPCDEREHEHRGEPILSI